MGQDKALMPFLGKPLIERVITRLRPLADEIFVTTNQPEKYRFLGLPLYPDLLPGRGALGGLFTALNAATQPLVAVIACDMPFANPGLLTYQRDQCQQEQADIAIPLLLDGYEPLHAIYRRETCLPAVKWALDADKWKLISWFSRVKVHAISAAECQVYDPKYLAFENVNTPQELADAEAEARQES